MEPLKSIILNLKSENIHDFFSLLFWTLRDFGCLSSSDYVYQDESKELHEIRYEIISTLSSEAIDKDLSKYIGVYITLKLVYDIKNPNENEIQIYAQELDHKDSFMKGIPWRLELIRLNKVSIKLSSKSVLKQMKIFDELNEEEIIVMSSNIENAILYTKKLIDKGPSIEHHTGLFFNSYKDFLDEYYIIDDYIIIPAHTKIEGIGDEHICISKISSEYSRKHSERRNFGELSFIGMLLGLITNRHFTLCESVPKITCEELKIPNFRIYSEKASDSKLLEFKEKYPKGEMRPIARKGEFAYSNIRFPDDTLDLILQYKNLSDKVKEVFEDTLRCYQLSLDLYEHFPTFSLVALLSSLESMIKLSEISIKRTVGCPICGYRYYPICPKCGKQYSLEGAKWKYLLEFIKENNSLNETEEEELSTILEESYHSIRSAAVHNAKLRGLEYDTEEKMRYYLPDSSQFVPSFLKLDYYYRSLKEVVVSTLLEWLRKQ